MVMTRLANSSFGSVCSNCSGNETMIFERSLTELLIGSIVFISIIIITGVGNSMVIYAIFTFRPLKRVQNFFIVSLAWADLAVGVLVMPFHVAKFVTARWPFGFVICQLWLTSDILLCTASIFNLCAIALDRYWAIHDPIKYANRRSKRLVLLMIAAVWIGSSLVSVPPLLGWNNWSEEGLAEQCVYTTERGFVIYSACCSFYLPLLVMTTVYFKIYMAARERLQRQNSTIRKGLAIVERSMRAPIEIGVHAHDNQVIVNYNSIDSSPMMGNSPHQCLLLPYPDTLVRNDSSGKHSRTPSVRSNRSNKSNSSRRSFFGRFSGRKQSRHSSKGTITEDYLEEAGAVESMHNFFREKEKISLSREKKAAKTLAVIMGVFVLCWLPFFMLYLANPFLEPTAINPKIFEATNWLGYVNSCLNPVIYTIFNNDFRNAFRRMICGARRKAIRRL